MPMKLSNMRTAVQPFVIRSYFRAHLQPPHSQTAFKSAAFTTGFRSISSSSPLSSGHYGSGQGPKPASTPAEQQRRQDQAAQEAQGPNMDTLPHVSEEAAAVGKAKGESGPDIEEQGTPVQEVS